VAGAGHDAFAHEEPHEPLPFVALRGERDEAGQAPRRLEQPLHLVGVRRADGVGRVGAAVAVGRADERTLDVDAGDEAPGEGILRAVRHQGRHPPLHPLERFGGEGGKDSRDAVGLEPLARGVQRVGGQAVAVEVHAAVAVDLEVEKAGRVAHGHLPLRDCLISRGWRVSVPV